MPPPDLEHILELIAEGALMKMGDVILMHTPTMIKKGVAYSIIVMAKKMTPGGKKPPASRKKKGGKR